MSNFSMDPPLIVGPGWPQKDSARNLSTDMDIIRYKSGLDPYGSYCVAGSTGPVGLSFT